MVTCIFDEIYDEIIKNKDNFSPRLMEYIKKHPNLTREQYINQFVYMLKGYQSEILLNKIIDKYEKIYNVKIK